MQPEYVYLIHFHQPISDRHTTQHYCGFALDVEARLVHHLTGRGARLCQVANERGIDYEVVRVWVAAPGKGRELERQIKSWKMGPALCPVCSSKRKGRRNQPYLPGLTPQAEALNFTLDDLNELAF
jgi:predicted GIY-YIG superfamily endonuclease